MAELVKISELEPTGNPGGKALLEVETPEDVENRSKSLPYRQLLGQIDLDTGMATNRFTIRKLSAELETPTLTATLDVNGFTDAYAPSALTENTRGSLAGISCYNLCAETVGFLARNEIPYISAENSPWAFASGVVGVAGDSAEKTASQKWLSDMKVSCDTLLCNGTSGDVSAVCYASGNSDHPFSARPVFNTKSRIYVCESTRDVNHAIVEINDASGYIFDTRDNSLSICDNGQLTEIFDYSPMKDAGYGSFIRNKTNSAFKTFYTTPMGFVKVLESGPTFRIVDHVLLEVVTNGFDTVIIPNDVTAIADEVFAGRGELTDVVVPDGVLSIGDYAFENCMGLTAVNVNENASLGQGAFFGCRGMVNGDGFVQKNNVVFDYFGPGGDIVVPQNTTRIDAYAFWNNCGITGVTIPSSVTSIGEGAFWRCRNLVVVDISGEPTIGDYAFRGCSGLADDRGLVAVKGVLYDYLGPGGTVEIPARASISAIAAGAFEGNTELLDIKIPKNVKRVGHDAFSGCSNLTGTWVGLKVDEIGQYAFWGCHGLRNVELGLSSATVGLSAFGDCPNLKKLVIHGYVTTNGNPGAAYLPNKKSHYPWGLQPEQVSYVVYRVVNQTLTAMTVNTNSTVIIPDKVESILPGGSYEPPGGIFPDSLTNVIFSDSGNLSYIGSRSFSDNTSLSSIELPYGVTTIQSRAFQGCRNITKISLPSTISQIYNSCFVDCTGLTGIDFPHSIQTIWENAFIGCTGIGDRNMTLNRINNKSWYNLSSSTDKSGNWWGLNTNVKFATLSYDVNQNSVLTGLSSIYGANKTWIMPDSVLTVASNATRRLNMPISRMVLSRNLVQISDHALTGIGGLTSVELRTSTTDVLGYAFADCMDLQYVSVPAYLSSIANDAFVNCGALSAFDVHPKNTEYKSVGNNLMSKDGKTLEIGVCGGKIPLGTTTIADSAFCGRRVPDGITLHNGVESIGVSAFANVAEAPYIDVPPTVDLTSIGQDAFRGYQGVVTFHDKTFDDVNGITATTGISNFRTIKYDVTDGVLAGVSLSWTGDAERLVFPNTVREIGTGALSGNGELRQVEMNDGVSSIGSGAFRDCPNLSAVDIPTSVVEIGAHAFYGNSSLGLVKVPSGIRFMGTQAFDNCPDITVDVEIRAVETDIGDMLIDIMEAQDNKTALFDPCEGTVVPGARMVPNGSAIGSLPEPIRGNRTFLGWFMDKTYTTQVFPDTPVTADMTLYAKWD